MGGWGASPPSHKFRALMVSAKVTVAVERYSELVFEKLLSFVP